MSKPVEVTDASFDEFVKNNPKVVVDCWAAWCAPCRMLTPIIDELAEEKADVKFAKLDVDKNRAVPQRYGIMSIPTLLYFKDGQLVDKTLGALPKAAIESRLANL
ncbi:thioredoxin [Candidatus Bathyarchaeota archaeon]|jgi:thioredoxin 1|nr:thioredoxin [Candidatus Bathyarchaeota archaeon]MBT4423267.1 thioredoxin [Candidatus Bathyarchaeota archaeon]MBT6603572.1 thioredoxin [Candidatus Bathyarchaeota archaeon]MBT7187061.1 thioredoxin [Candidatus Bathyarchaeota archaeon]MBT7914624.1 thioredoxin [Candidatus Bathyarchaeota archaeon]